jgi:hypothetical protein
LRDVDPHCAAARAAEGARAVGDEEVDEAVTVQVVGAHNIDDDVRLLEVRIHPGHLHDLCHQELPEGGDLMLRLAFFRDPLLPPDDSPDHRDEEQRGCRPARDLTPAPPALPLPEHVKANVEHAGHEAEEGPAARLDIPAPVHPERLFREPSQRGRQRFALRRPTRLPIDDHDEDVLSALGVDEVLHLGVDPPGGRGGRRGHEDQISRTVQGFTQSTTEISRRRQLVVVPEHWP